MEYLLATKICLKEEIERYGWSIGDHTYGAPLLLDYDYGALTIGRFCSIAPGTSFILGNHRTDLVSTYPFKVLSQFWPGAEHADSDHEDRGGIHVGSDVWFGAHCTVLTGAKIGSGAVIAANSVVTKDVPPYAIVAGNPGRIVRYRCSESQIQDLLDLAWWDWPDEKIKSEVPFLTTLSVADFIERHKSAAETASRGV